MKNVSTLVPTLWMCAEKNEIETEKFIQKWKTPLMWLFKVYIVGICDVVYNEENESMVKIKAMSVGIILYMRLLKEDWSGMGLDLLYTLSLHLSLCSATFCTNYIHTYSLNHSFALYLFCTKIVYYCSKVPNFNWQYCVRHFMYNI